MKKWLLGFALVIAAAFLVMKLSDHSTPIDSQDVRDSIADTQSVLEQKQLRASPFAPVNSSDQKRDVLQTVATAEAIESEAQRQLHLAARDKCSSSEAVPTVPHTAAPVTYDEGGEAVLDVRQIDPRKDKCETVANAVRDASIIFEVSATNAVWYSTVRPNYGSVLQDAILSALCTSQELLSPKYEVEFELMAITADAQATVLVGNSWVSDGVFVAPMLERDYKNIRPVLVGRRAGPLNMQRDAFEARLTQQEFNRYAAVQERQRRDAEALRSAQQRPMFTAHAPCP